jgi:hypothetical protein
VFLEEGGGHTGREPLQLRRDRATLGRCRVDTRVLEPEPQRLVDQPFGLETVGEHRATLVRPFRRFFAERGRERGQPSPERALSLGQGLLRDEGAQPREGLSGVEPMVPRTSRDPSRRRVVDPSERRQLEAWRGSMAQAACDADLDDASGDGGQGRSSVDPPSLRVLTQHRLDVARDRVLGPAPGSSPQLTRSRREATRADSASLRAAVRACASRQERSRGPTGSTRGAPAPTDPRRAPPRGAEGHAAGARSSGAPSDASRDHQMAQPR